MERLDALLLRRADPGDAVVVREERCTALAREEERLTTEREAVLEAEAEAALRDTELREEPPRLTWLREAPLP